jgi:hypothetical protein
MAGTSPGHDEGAAQRAAACSRQKIFERDFHFFIDLID